MTFTVLARCPRTRTLGVALTTSALGVASRCPRVDGSVAAVCAQASTDWRLSLRGVRLSAAGLDPGQVLAALRSTDEHEAYRQIGIVDRAGRAAAYTGDAVKPEHAHLVGDGFVVMGNNVRAAAVVDAMAGAYRQGGDLPIEERLLRAVEAGRDAGGGNRGQLSAGLVTAEPGADRPRVDLRVDMTAAPDGDAVAELRRVFDAYHPLTDYYHRYWPDHPETTTAEWLSRHRRTP